MRFISKFGRFGVQIRPMIAEAYATGTMRVVQEPVYALFEPNKLLPHEREMAVQHWSFNGSYQEQDEVTTVPPDYRIGVYDSVEHQQQQGFGDDIRLLIEKTLCEHAEIYPDILVVRVEVHAPWPRYDEFRGTPAALVRRLVEDGHDLDAVLEYERQTQARPKVIEEIEKAIDGSLAEEEPEEIVVG